jgi:hypothetical protein
MFDTGPPSGWRPASIGSISSRYQRTPETVRSTEVSAWRQGLPISQVSSRASSSRLASSWSTQRATRARRSSRSTPVQRRCSAAAAATASSAWPSGSIGGPAIAPPSTGLEASAGSPASRHSPPHRLRTRSASNASGATWRQRP